MVPETVVFMHTLICCVSLAIAGSLLEAGQQIVCGGSPFTGQKAVPFCEALEGDEYGYAG
jgi:hypothetical protein